VLPEVQKTTGKRWKQPGKVGCCFWFSGFPVISCHTRNASKLVPADLLSSWQDFCWLLGQP